ncbi:MAG: HD domain-containing protein [Gammaproteobacteria bacterium]|nr:HD domain-containing protein [Gammaproteobacteria bacterium]
MVTIKQKFPPHPDGTINIEAWIAHFKRYTQLQDLKTLETAIEFTRTTSLGLTTFYGQSYLEQGLEMADILLEMRLDADTAAAAIAVGIARQLQIKHEILQKTLGDPITQLIADVLQMDTLDNLQARGHIQITRLRKAFLAMTSDIRAVLIRLAERTCIMRGIKKINPAERARIAQDTLNIYAPLANRLGIGQLKWELEDNAFHFIHPEIYKKIAHFLAEKRLDREKRIHDNIEMIQSNLKKAGVSAKISGRAKHIHSIYLKATRKQVDYEQIYDCSALRILVKDTRACYTALSIVHELFQQIPEEFDDYISRPKPNGYRSIHTAVIDQSGNTLEIQIRTEQMHDEAEHGVAAHWMYKESGNIEARMEARVKLLRQLLDWQTDVTQQTPQTTQPLNDTIYVLTPAGEIIDLPVGATPIDFAYRVHTQVGHRCRGAKIHGHIVPLTRTLQTGDVIEIMTAAVGGPSRDWLNQHAGYIQSARTRAKIAHYFRQLDVQEEILEHKPEKELHPKKITHTGPPIVSQREVPTKSGFNIDGVDDLLTRIARCCNPIPGDAIMGYITQGRGISIHRHNCNNIRQDTNLGRLIPVTWDTTKQEYYYAELEIHARSRENLLKEITALLSNLKMDLISLKSAIGHKTHVTHILMTVKVKDSVELSHLMHQLNQLSNVISVKRT